MTPAFSGGSGGILRRNTPPGHRSGVPVRQATVGDVAVVVDLRLRLLREYADHPVYGRLHPDAGRRALELYRKQLMSDDQAIFLAEHDEAAIGIARCVESVGSPLLKPDRYCYLSSVYVEPAFRRLGVLHALIERAEAWARERGLTEMRLHNASGNADAVASWDALGFDVVEQVRVRLID
jgi:ribosomal protein S18 acetylase RimI-like enzyme